MIRTITVALLALASPLAAQEHAWQSFFDNGDVTLDAGVETVELGGDVVLQRRGSGSGWVYEGHDLSGLAPVGCLVAVYSEVDVIAHRCDGVLEAEAQEKLGGLMERLKVYYAANAVPAVSEEAFAEAQEVRRAGWAGVCPANDDEIAAARANITPWLGFEILADVEASLAVPRLPVVNPCN